MNPFAFLIAAAGLGGFAAGGAVVLGLGLLFGVLR
jgi:hypothetical protein